MEPSPALARPSRISGPVVAIGIVVVAVAGGLGVGLGALHQQSVALPKSTDLTAEPAAAALAPVVKGGEPPPDVLSRLVVPAGATVTARHDLADGAGQYDSEVVMSVPAPTADVLGFYARALPAHGWKLGAATTTHDGRGTQVLGQRISIDTFVWEVGVTVEPGPGGSALTLRVFQAPEG